MLSAYLVCSEWLSYCCLPVSSKQSVRSPLNSGISDVCSPWNWDRFSFSEEMVAWENPSRSRSAWNFRLMENQIFVLTSSLTDIHNKVARECSWKLKNSSQCFIVKLCYAVGLWAPFSDICAPCCFKFTRFQSTLAGYRGVNAVYVKYVMVVSLRGQPLCPPLFAHQGELSVKNQYLPYLWRRWGAVILKSHCAAKVSSTWGTFERSHVFKSGLPGDS